jgi:hypothetical protein
MKSANGTIIHSDAFDVYPWFVGLHDHLGAVTPAMVGIHNVEKLQAQSAPVDNWYGPPLAGRDLGEVAVLLRARRR